MARQQNYRTFTIAFPDGRHAPAIQLDPEADPRLVVEAFGLVSPRPTIFITGGASLMSDEDIERTRQVIEDGIASFASERGVTVVDGGTEAGVMQMMGIARSKNAYKFPLIGVAPASKVDYPGGSNPDKEADLDQAHSHFVLVNAPDWGGESSMIVRLARAIAAGQPCMGILINGGRIAEQDVYIATVSGDDRVPVMVLEGSGRASDEIAAAVHTGHAERDIIRDITTRGDIRLARLDEGPSGLRRRLDAMFQRD